VTRLSAFNPDTGTHPPGTTLLRTACVPFNRLRTGVGHFRSCLNKRVWSPLQPGSVAQKNKPLAKLPSNVQSINLLMDSTAWRFWTMRQLNGCSTLAPRSSAAKQWTTTTRSDVEEKEDEFECKNCLNEIVVLTSRQCQRKNLPKTTTNDLSIESAE